MAKGHFFRQCRTSIIGALRLTFKAGAWILKTPFAVIIIASGMLFDHVVRLQITLNSQYFRLIHLPEATFGLIGSGMALLGLFIPRLARRMAESRTPAFNLYVLACMTVIGLYAMTWFIPYFGLVPMLLLYAVMMMTGFFLSHYLNEITDSDQRATVLSFRGLSYNLAYGLIGVMYSGLLAMLRTQSRSTGVSAVDLENSVFIESIGWFPGYFLAGFILIWIWGAVRLRHSRAHRQMD
jgi:hypothetical protein